LIRRIPAELARHQPVRSLFAVSRELPAPALDVRQRMRAQVEGLLRDELTLAPERIARLIERELARFRRSLQVAIRLHPDDVATIECAAELAARFELGSVELLADASLTRGGCMVSSERGELDARVETRVERMIALLCGEQT
jgi:flagellar biosynthesis/type III secretory pathway protein FliH